MASSLFFRWFASRTRLQQNFSLCPPQKLVKYSQEKDSKRVALKKSIYAKSDETALVPLDLGTKNPPKAHRYVGLILAALGAAGIFVWALRRVMYDRTSPRFIYQKTLKRIAADPHVIELLGNPIKELVEEAGHRVIAYNCSRLEGVPLISMQFLVQGANNEALVDLEMRETSNGSMEYQYLAVQLNCFPHFTLVLVDKRSHSPDALRSRLHELNFVWQYKYPGFWR